MTKTKVTSSQLLKGRRLAIIGYGSQGRAQALNLRDSGHRPIIGLLPGSRSRPRARRDGFEIAAPAKTIAMADIIAILIPDHRQQMFFKSLPVGLLDNKALIFAHGLAISFGLVKPPLSCDVILVAPHGPGVRIRELYQEGSRFTAFWAIEQNYSGRAILIAKAYAGAIGCPPKNLFKTTFRQEAVGDIFGEQAVLCGGLVGLMESGFDTLVKRGFSPESAYLECIHQLDSIVDLVKKHGPAGMFERISVTAAYGSLLNKEQLSGPEQRRKMAAMLKQIEDGRFVRKLMVDSRHQMADFKRKSGDIRSSELQRIHDRLRKKLDKS